jgi:hypothetical protein
LIPLPRFRLSCFKRPQCFRRQTPFDERVGKEMSLCSSFCTPRVACHCGLAAAASRHQTSLLEEGGQDLQMQPADSGTGIRPTAQHEISLSVRHCGPSAGVQGGEGDGQCSGRVAPTCQQQ